VLGVYSRLEIWPRDEWTVTQRQLIAKRGELTQRLRVERERTKALRLDDKPY
jgi:DNA-binding transcriptional regulator/RsmH inhibitor MraZ